MAVVQEQLDLHGIRLLRLSGSLTQLGMEALEPAVEKALPDGSRAVIDLGDVDMVTTPGLALLISTTQRLRDTRGRVVFANARVGVLNVLHRCKLDEVIDIVSDRDEAVEMAKS
jgi:anti-sigma B factor antagonist/stage II sporulation protein AA (anti-sigma F factor antagonist)